VGADGRQQSDDTSLTAHPMPDIGRIVVTGNP